MDDELPTARQFLQAYKKKDAVFAFFSDALPCCIHPLCVVGGIFDRSLGQFPPVFNRRRCAAEWKGNRYSNQKLHERLGWKPRVPMKEAMEAFLGQFGKSEDGRTEVRGQKADDRSVSRSAYVKTTTRKVNR